MTAIINLKTSFPFKGTQKDLFTLGYPGLENPISSNHKEKLRWKGCFIVISDIKKKLYNYYILIMMTW